MLSRHPTAGGKGSLLSGSRVNCSDSSAGSQHLPADLRPRLREVYSVGASGQLRYTQSTAEEREARSGGGTLSPVRLRPCLTMPELNDILHATRV